MGGTATVSCGGGAVEQEQRCEPGRQQRCGGAGMALQAWPVAVARRSSGAGGGAQQPSRGLPRDPWELGLGGEI